MVIPSLYFITCLLSIWVYQNIELFPASCSVLRGKWWESCHCEGEFPGFLCVTPCHPPSDSDNQSDAQNQSSERCETGVVWASAELCLVRIGKVLKSSQFVKNNIYGNNGPVGTTYMIIRTLRSICQWPGQIVTHWHQWGETVIQESITSLISELSCDERAM